LVNLTNSSGSYPTDEVALGLAVDRLKKIGMPIDSLTKISDFSRSPRDPHGAAPLQVQVDAWAKRSPTFSKIITEVRSYFDSYGLTLSEDLASRIATSKHLWKSKGFSFSAVQNASRLVAGWVTWSEDSDPNLVLHLAMLQNMGRPAWEKIRDVLDAVRTEIRSEQ
jgi:hypothetical protein